MNHALYYSAGTAGTPLSAAGAASPAASLGFTRSLSRRLTSTPA